MFQVNGMSGGEVVYVIAAGRRVSRHLSEAEVFETREDAEAVAEWFTAQRLPMLAFVVVEL